MSLENEWKSFLVAPSAKGGVQKVFECWKQKDILMEVPVSSLPKTMGENEMYALPGRIRGALGIKLMESASEQALDEQACIWNPPCAFDIFFQSQFKMSGGLELPRPFNVVVIREEESLFIKVSVFGHAVQYAEAIAEALIRALQGGLIFEQGGLRALSVKKRFVIDAPLHFVDELPYSISMNFMMPFCQRKKNEFEVSLVSLLVGLLGRIKGMALWHGIELDIIWKNYKAIFSDLEWDASHLSYVKWFRRSSRQSGRMIPMEGAIGPLLIRGDLRLIVPLLLIGERVGVGAHTGHGMGQFFVEFI